MTTNKITFDILTIIARPAAGKSEIIDYLKKIPQEQRVEHFHIGAFEEIDDFPMLWRWFEEDAILSRMRQPRLHTDDEGYFASAHLWNVLIRLMSLDYHKRVRDMPDYHASHTTIFEFSRGKEHGGYRAAFDHFDEEILQKMAVIYINVSWEESLRKNRKRFNPSRPDSILEHGLPDEKLERLYRETDWQSFSSVDPQYLHVKERKIPYVVFENEDDVTTERGEALGARLAEALGRLWKAYSAGKSSFSSGGK